MFKFPYVAEKSSALGHIKCGTLPYISSCAVLPKDRVLYILMPPYGSRGIRTPAEHRQSSPRHLRHFVTSRSVGKLRHFDGNW